MPASIDGINKTCSRCNETKHIDEFSVDKSRPDGHHSYCKVCDAAYNSSKASFAAAIRDALSANNNTKLIQVVDTIIEKATEGDMGAAKLLIDRLDGAVKQQIEHSGEVKNNGVEQLVATAAELMEKIKGQK
jgi:uncharacterized protein (DUF1501 family)